MALYRDFSGLGRPVEPKRSPEPKALPLFITLAPPPIKPEPHSAEVIRALEVHINGRVLSPAPKEGT